MKELFGEAVRIGIGKMACELWLSANLTCKGCSEESLCKEWMGKARQVASREGYFLSEERQKDPPQILKALKEIYFSTEVRGQ